jgi:hypothetical protein
MGLQIEWKKALLSQDNLSKEPGLAMDALATVEHCWIKTSLQDGCENAQ